MGLEAAATLVLEVNPSPALTNIQLIEDKLKGIGLQQIPINTSEATQQVKVLEREVGELKKQLDASAAGMLKFSASSNGIGKTFNVAAKDVGGLVASLEKFKTEAAGMASRGIDFSQLVKGTKLAQMATEDNVRGLGAYIKRLEEVKTVLAKSGSPSTVLRQYGDGALEAVANLDMLKSRLVDLQRLSSQTAAQAKLSAPAMIKVYDTASIANAQRSVNATASSYSDEYAADQRAAKNLLALKAATRAQLKLEDDLRLADIRSAGEKAAAATKIAAAQAEASTKYLASTPKQQASQTLRASIATSKDYDTSKYAPEAVAAAQSLGSTQAAKAALDALSASHAKAVPAVKAHTEATKLFSAAQINAHSFARGLSGALGTLWMTYGAIVPLMAGAALAGGFMKATKAGSEFAYQLTFVKALGGESAESVASIGTAALNLSKNSMYGPVELANGLRMLSQAGLSAAKSMEALPTVMQLATVGEMSMEQASITLVGVMNAFGMALADLPHIGDMFAKAAALSQTSVAGMTEAMKTASVVHDQYGASVEDTATAITLLAKVNIVGTAAGTSYRNMLKDLYTPSKDAAKVLKQLGIETRDSVGNLREAPEIMFDLQRKLKDFTQGSQTDILGKIFSERGGKEAVQILNQTRESWDALKNNISNSDGFMSKVTSELELTTKGRFQQALNTLQSNLIGAFDSSEGSVRGLADSLKNLANSPEVIAGINAIVGSMASLARVIIDLIPTLIKLGEAWVVFKGLGLAVAGIKASTTALAGLGIASSVVSAEMALAGGGIAGLTKGLLATGGAAAAAAGATGLGAIGGAIALLSNPLTWAVAGVGALALAALTLKDNTPKGVSALQDFNTVLDRQIEKLRAANAEMVKKNRLQNTGAELDMSEAQRRVSAANAEKAAALARIEARNKTLGNSSTGKDWHEAKDANQQDLLTVQSADAAIKGLGTKLLEAGNQQDQLNRSTLAGVISQAKAGLEDVQGTAQRFNRTVSVSAVQAVINALETSTGNPAQVRKLQKDLEFAMTAAQLAAMGTGTKTFAIDPKTPKAPSAAKVESAKFKEDKSSLSLLASEQESELNLIDSSNQSKLISEETYRKQVADVYAKYQGDIEAGYADSLIRLASLMKSTSGLEKSQATEEFNKTLEGLDRYHASKELKLKKSLDREAKISLDGFAAINKQIAEQEAVTDEAKRKLQANRIKLSMTPEQAAYYDASSTSLAKSNKGIADQQAKLDEMKNATNPDTGEAIYAAGSKAIQDQVDMLDRLIDARQRLADSAGEVASEEAKFTRSFETGWATALKNYSDNATNSANTANETFSVASKTMEASMVEFVTTGKLSFKSLASSILAESARVMANKAVASLLGNLTGLIGGLFGGPASGTGAGTAAVGSLWGAPVASAKGNVFSGSASLHQYANTVQTNPRAFVFDNLHGFAKGGVFAEDGPEAVMPLSQDSQGRLGVALHGGGGGVNVVISLTINEADGSAKQSTSGDSAGAWTAFAGRVKGLILDEMNTQKRPGGLLYA